jgi:DNA-binding transcriptional LysR family regulator
MTDQLAALRLFVRLAHVGNFSQVAREQKLSQPTASRLIADLESRLDVTLFTRTTRAVTLTQAGTDYLRHIQPILSALAEADHAVRNTGELRGALHVAVASITASRVIIPRIGEFMTAHPNLDVRLSTEDRRQNLLADGIDVAVRSGKLDDSSARSRRIGVWPLVMAAAPRYLASRATPQTPADLAVHEFVVAGPVAGRTLTMSHDDRKVSVQVSGRLAINGTDSAVAAGIEGVGIVVASLPSFRREIERGTLVRLLSDWDIGELEVHALFPSGQAPKPAARAFVDFLVDLLRHA